MRQLRSPSRNDYRNRCKRDAEPSIVLKKDRKQNQKITESKNVGGVAKQNEILSFLIFRCAARIVTEFLVDETDKILYSYELSSREHHLQEQIPGEGSEAVEEEKSERNPRERIVVAAKSPLRGQAC